MTAGAFGRQLALNSRQAHLIGTLRRADESWLELWDLAKRAGYTAKVTAANVRELRRRGLMVTRPVWGGCSTVEVSLAGAPGRFATTEPKDGPSPRRA